MISYNNLDLFPSSSTQTIIHGDCLEEMRKMEENSIDCIVTDPPYGLHFMGKNWDGRIPSIEYWQEALRICKPGAHLLAFGGSRTHHHLMCAIEGAGWEIRDCLMWLYGSGFPKSHNHFGLPGYGTALKPAYEPIIMAMKPLEGTFAQNAEKWGVAGINIDECRVGNTPDFINRPRGPTSDLISQLDGHGTLSSGGKGRWPANIIFDEAAAALLDEQSGNLGKSQGGKSGHIKAYSGGFKQEFYGNEKPGLGDSGGASRFFYCAKASSSERNAGLHRMPLKDSNKIGIFNEPGNNGSLKNSNPMQNSHPTVKPIKLMEYLLKLVMPPSSSAIVLDPFAGSGTTILAAKRLGFNAIGIEKEEEYIEIATKRIENG